MYCKLRSPFPLVQKWSKLTCPHQWVFVWKWIYFLICCPCEQKCKTNVSIIYQKSLFPSVHHPIDFQNVTFWKFKVYVLLQPVRVSYHLFGQSAKLDQIKLAFFKNCIIVDWAWTFSVILGSSCSWPWLNWNIPDFHRTVHVWTSGKYHGEPSMLQHMLPKLTAHQVK